MTRNIRAVLALCGRSSLATAIFTTLSPVRLNPIKDPDALSIICVVETFCTGLTHMTMKTPGATAEFLSDAIETSALTHIEIAERAGFGASNVISMMRLGRMKVPIDRIPDLAGACGIDPRRFLRIAMAEYHPDVWEVLRGSFGDVLTRPEQDLLSVFRVLNQDGEIEIDLELTEALAGLFVLASQRTPRADPFEDET